jgi:hypothetical protein
MFKRPVTRMIDKIINVAQRRTAIGFGNQKNKPCANEFIRSPAEIAAIGIIYERQRKASLMVSRWSRRRYDRRLVGRTAILVSFRRRNGK